MIDEHPLTHAASAFGEVLEQARLSEDQLEIVKAAMAHAVNPSELFASGPTSNSAAMLERCDTAIATYKEMGQKVPKATLDEREKWKRKLSLCERRDRLHDDRQRAFPGCICLGFGGRVPQQGLAIPTPDGRVVVDADFETFRDPCPCPLGTAHQQRVAERRRSLLAEDQQRRIDKLWTQLQMPAGLGETITLKTHPDQPLMRRIRRWYGREARPGLIMIGANRRGKTTTARLLARQAIVDGLGVIGANVPDLIERLTDTFNHDHRLKSDPDHPPQTTHHALIASLQSVDFLLLDDLGVEKASEYVERALYQILDARCDSSWAADGRIAKLLIITTNLSVRELAVRFGGRLWSRMTELSNFVEFTNEMIGPAAAGPQPLPDIDELPL